MSRYHKWTNRHSNIGLPTTIEPQYNLPLHFSCSLSTTKPTRVISSFIVFLTNLQSTYELFFSLIFWQFQRKIFLIFFFHSLTFFFILWFSHLPFGFLRFWLLNWHRTWRLSATTSFFLFFFFAMSISICKWFWFCNCYSLFPFWFSYSDLFFATFCLSLVVSSSWWS